MSDEGFPTIWDVQKAILNERKHGVAFDEAATIFLDPFELTFPDPDHSADEDRWVNMGVSDQDHLLVGLFGARRNPPADISQAGNEPGTANL